MIFCKVLDFDYVLDFFIDFLCFLCIFLWFFYVFLCFPVYSMFFFIFFSMILLDFLWYFMLSSLSTQILWVVTCSSRLKPPCYTQVNEVNLYGSVYFGINVQFFSKFFICFVMILLIFANIYACFAIIW